METDKIRLVVVVEAPPGTGPALVRDTVSEVLLGEQLARPDAPLADWDIDTTIDTWTTVDVSDVDGVLAGFEPRQSDDGVKSDLELTCTTCGIVLCDVEHGDGMDTLVRMCLDHEHGKDPNA